MRDRVVVTAIILYDEEICNEIYKSLRYSTHVKLLIIKKREQQFLSSYRCTVKNIDKTADSTFICKIKRLVRENSIELLFIASFKVNNEIILLANEIDIKIANGSFYTNYENKYQKILVKFLIDIW